MFADIRRKSYNVIRKPNKNKNIFIKKFHKHILIN